MKFLYACYGHAGLDCLYQLLNQRECNEEDLFVVTYKLEENRTLIEHLEALKINYTTKSIRDYAVVKQIEKFAPDFMFSIYFRDIFKGDILNNMREKAINLHPSLLPDYKGCFSAPWVIINGESKTGISYHIMNEDVDAGNIIIQKELEIRNEDTAFSLYHKLVALGVEYFSEMFQLVVRKRYSGTPQESGGRRYGREIPYGGYLDLSWDQKKIHNFIRSTYFPPYNGAKLRFGGDIIEFKTSGEFEEFCIKKGINIQ